MKRLILILTVAAMTVAMTLGAAGLAGAQEAPGAPSADELFTSMGFIEDPAAPGCYFAFGTLYVGPNPPTTPEGVVGFIRVR